MNSINYSFQIFKKDMANVSNSIEKYMTGKADQKIANVALLALAGLAALIVGAPLLLASLPMIVVGGFVGGPAGMISGICIGAAGGIFVVISDDLLKMAINEQRTMPVSDDAHGDEGTVASAANGIFSEVKAFGSAFLGGLQSAVDGQDFSAGAARSYKKSKASDMTEGTILRPLWKLILSHS